MASNNVPLHNVDIERSIIGAALVEWLEVFEGVQPDDFWVQSHAEVWAAVKRVAETGQPDAISVCAITPSHQELVQEISAEVFSAAHGSTHVAILFDLADKRKALNAMRDAAQALKSASTTAQDALTAVEKISGCFRVVKDEGRPRHVSVYLKEAANNLIAKSKGELTGVPSGLRELDITVGGFQPGDLYIIAARPAMGKTALAFDFARSACLAGKTVVAFELEMSSSSTIQRVACRDAGVSMSAVSRGLLATAKLPALASSFKAINNWPLYVDFTTSKSVKKMWRDCEEVSRKTKVDMVIVDHIQLCRSGYNLAEPRVDLSRASNLLKEMAKGLNCPVIALSQLSREVEKRPEHRPQLSDLNETGKIEQDADVVIFLKRDHYYDKSADPGKATLMVAKQRNGPTQDLSIGWDGNVMGFGDYATAQNYDTTKWRGEDF